jgi:hypothetical protein
LLIAGTFEQKAAVAFLALGLARGEEIAGGRRMASFS